MAVRASLRLRLAVIMAAAGVGGNGSPAASQDSTGLEVQRVTKETNMHAKINLDGTGLANSPEGYRSWITCLVNWTHGLFDVYVKTTGDTHIDDRILLWQLERCYFKHLEIERELIGLDILQHHLMRQQLRLLWYAGP